MLGIIAWIRPDGHSALVVVSGSDRMASGDPGAQAGESLKVGDMVFMSGMNEGGDTFASGLRLVHAGFWPRIVQDIAQMGRTGAVQAASACPNVVSIFSRRQAQASRALPGAARRARALLAAE